MKLSDGTIKKLVSLSRQAPITWMCTTDYLRIIANENLSVDPLSIDTQILVQKEIDDYKEHLSED